MSLIAPLEPGARARELARSGSVLLVPVVLAFPVFLLVGLLSMGDPVGCPVGVDPSTCGVAELERDRAVLLALTIWIPFALFLLTVSTVIVLAALRRRTFLMASVGVALMALSTVSGLVYRILEL